MWKPLLTSLTLSATTLLAASTAQAQIQTPVMAQCPQATWTNGYHIWEFIPLSSPQSQSAVISRDSSHLRDGVGYDSRVLFTMNPGEQVTVMGEAWDMGCNRWMNVFARGGNYWVHVDNLRFIRF